MSLRTPVARARGLGSAREGAHHWWLQRVTAVAMVPLTLWFVIAVIAHMGATHAEMVAWLSHPLSAAMMIAFVTAGFYHAALGMQVVYEDYVHPRWLEVTLIVGTKLVLAFLAIACVVSVLKIAFGG